MINNDDKDDITLIFTFQSGYIQILHYLCGVVLKLSLYIPIWLYSNVDKMILNTSTNMAFTFQSGYIQIITAPCPLASGLHFTFQSGYIQIFYNLKRTTSGYSLHSNLVIFKYFKKFVNYYILKFFTFQSGYIQMIDVTANVPVIISFTFQSGYIQIMYKSCKVNLIDCFTFQSGYIQIYEDVSCL